MEFFYIAPWKTPGITLHHLGLAVHVSVPEAS